MIQDYSQEIENIDRLTHQLGKLYKTRFETGISHPLLKQLSTIEMAILNLLQWNPDITISEIAASLEAPNSTLSSAINRLEKKKVLYRQIGKTDRRSFTLALTPVGKELLKERIKQKTKLYRLVLSALDTNQERKNLLNLLEKIHQNLLAQFSDDKSSIT